MIEKILVLAPSVVSKGERATIWIGTWLGLSELSFVIITPNKTALYPNFRARSTIGAKPVAGIGTSAPAFPLYEADVTFSVEGSYVLYAYGVEAGPGATLEGGAHVTCANWASNMDKPVSNIDKANTEISRLRTNIRRQSD